MEAIFKVGQRVVVVTGGSRYRGKYAGCHGEIYSVYEESVAVRLDGQRNKASSFGVFYFTPANLRHEEETKSKEDTKMQKMTNYVNVADVQFLDEKEAFRTFEYANYDPDIKPGDLCVVMSAHHGLGLAEVIDIKQTATGDLYREIVSKVDTSVFDARVELRKRAAELKQRMQERAKKLQDIVLYQTLAKEDAEMAQMLQEFKGLGI